MTANRLRHSCLICDGPCRRDGALCRECHVRWRAAKAAVSAPERFWAKVDQSGECWVWTGARSPGGYGRFRDDGRAVEAHRWAYEAVVGPIPEGKQLDHLCRVRECVNPAHLEPVTHIENIRRGLHPGNPRPQIRLTADQVRDIRTLLSLGVRRVAISRTYSVSPETVRRIADGRTWAGVA